MIRTVCRSYGADEAPFDRPLPSTPPNDEGVGGWPNDEGKTLRDLWRASFTLVDLDVARAAFTTWRSQHPRKVPTPADLHSTARTSVTKAQAVPCARCGEDCTTGDEHPCCRLHGVEPPRGRCPACHMPDDFRNRKVDRRLAKS